MHKKQNFCLSTQSFTSFTIVFISFHRVRHMSTQLLCICSSRATSERNEHSHVRTVAHFEQRSDRRCTMEGTHPWTDLLLHPLWIVDPHHELLASWSGIDVTHPHHTLQQPKVIEIYIYIYIYICTWKKWKYKKYMYI